MAAASSSRPNTPNLEPSIPGGAVGNPNLPDSWLYDQRPGNTVKPVRRHGPETADKGNAFSLRNSIPVLR